MKFTVSGNFFNASYVDEDGRVVYKVQTSASRYPEGGGRKKTSTKICKILPEGIPRRSAPDGKTERRGDRFAYLTRIVWRASSSTVYRTGEEIPLDQLLTTEGNLEGKSSRRTHKFFGDDAKEYTWVSGSCDEELLLFDGTNALIATFYRQNPRRSVLRNKRPVLEIQPQGVEMSDMILTTLICVEKVLRESPRQTASRTFRTSSGSSRAKVAKEQAGVGILKQVRRLFPNSH